MGVREAKVEVYLIKQIRKIGGISYKWVSPGHNGVPDRIVIFKGFVAFVEVKSLNGVESPSQIRESERITKHGATSMFIYGNEDVDLFIDLLNAHT